MRQFYLIFHVSSTLTYVAEQILVFVFLFVFTPLNTHKYFLELTILHARHGLWEGEKGGGDLRGEILSSKIIIFS